MGASSVTGTGMGSCGKPTTVELAAWANAPAIMIAGRTDTTEIVSSPPTQGAVITLPTPLPGGADSYAVILTSLNGGSTYVADMTEEDGNFTSFTFVSESEGTVMYIVVKIGVRS